MKRLAVAVLFLLAVAAPVRAQITAFTHVIVIMQENRTPDNLFYALCDTQPCSTTDNTEYDIQTDNWLSKHGKNKTVTPGPVPLDNNYDLGHSHAGFLAMCDFSDPTTCQMDGAAGIGCSGTCPQNPQFKYVDNSSGSVQPYLDLATQYGWANFMFQTNQGPSFPAHQFVFGGTSAPSQSDDQAGTFASENYKSSGDGGCLAPAGTVVPLIDANGNEKAKTYPCFEHATLSDLLDQASIGWKYYAADSGGPRRLWNAPLAIDHICVPEQSGCTGSDWANVDSNPSDVLTDIANCQLRGVSWVMPTGANSDHPRSNTGGGPSWVASIVNAVGESQCVDPNGQSYWNNTAIVVTWDDWGGWYDHEPPTILGYPQGAYQYGFRVPMIFISAYTPAAYIDNNRSDFGSIVRFAEANFGVTEGSLGFADSRAPYDLSGFYNLQASPRAFVPINAPKDMKWFINDHSPQTPPDDD